MAPTTIQSGPSALRNVAGTVFTLLFPLRDYYVNLITKGGIIREAGILERQDYFFNALKSSCRYGFN